jgi:transposase
MINLPAGTRILLATRPVDFRKGAHGLAALAQEVLAEDAFSGTVIVYRSKRSDRLKILVWDTSGLVLVWKQMQQGSFRWPPIVDGWRQAGSSSMRPWSRCSIPAAGGPRRAISGRSWPRFRPRSGWNASGGHCTR